MSHGPRAQCKRGYTIMEMLFATWIFAFLISTVFAGLLWRAQRVASDFEESSAGAVQAVFAIRRISGDVRRNVPVFSANKSSLELRSPDGNHVRYSLEDGDLVRRSGPPGDEKGYRILGGVSDFVVEAGGPDPGVISITIKTLQKRRVGEDLETSYPFRCAFRAGYSK